MNRRFARLLTPFLFSMAASTAQESSFTVERDVAYLPEGRNEKLDLYLPEGGSANRPAVLVIHGGGWRVGDKADKRELQIAETLAKAGFVVASVNYLMHPVPMDRKDWASDKAIVYPRNVQDCKAAIRWLRVNAEKYRIRPDAIGTIGGSAGGHLSMLMAWSGDVKELDPPEYPGVSTKIQAVVNLYGIPDVRKPIGKGWEKSKTACGKGWTGKSPAEDPALYALISPIDHLKTGSAPILTFHGTKDETVPYSYSVELQPLLEAKGVRHEFITVEGAPHTFLIQTEKYGDYRPKIVSFFTETLGAP